MLVATEDLDVTWKSQSWHVPRDRALWQALYSVVPSLSMATQMCDEIIIWPQGVRPPMKYLKRWAQEIDSGEIVPDPAAEKLMRNKVESYKSIRHWQFLESNLRAAIKLANQLEETGEIKQAVALSYLGNNINYGMDKGEHATKQLPQSINMGNVRIISSRGPSISPAMKKKAKRLIEAEVKVLE